MRLDLHVHSMERSPCGRSGEENVIEAGIKFGLDGLFFTDHNVFLPGSRCLELNRKYKPFKVFSGIEVSIESEHFLVFGIKSKKLESKDWTYTNLRRYVKEKKGFIVLAHPFRHAPVEEEIFKDPPDALEVVSRNVDPENQLKIRKAAKNMGCLLVSASDSHSDEHVGICHVELARPMQDEKGVITCLREGDYACRVEENRFERYLEEKRQAEEAAARQGILTGE